MTIVSEELVLCTAVADLPTAWLPIAGAVAMDEATLYQHLDPLPPHWLPRSQAEQNTRYKQWIPYLLLLNPRKQIAAYARQGAETRLHGRCSVGIGGHINPGDAPETEGPFAWRDTIHNCLRRELNEEFPAALPGRTRFLGLIHESLTPVGQVHLGLVFLHQLFHQPGPAGPELQNLQWLAPATVGRLPAENGTQFELWSQLALQLLPPVLP
ncbi:MAG: NUDIX domain-containing protein [Verrucomicrobiae bacterium]|nr:NUDIX domain-containing protein [Verrucomicrobiae bacterium]